MGVGGGTRGGARPPSHVAYYVALAGILALLLLLLAYFTCFCLKRVKELVQDEYCSRTPVPPPPPPPATAAYPVQPVVRDTASAMAKLCRQLPAPTLVYPASTSPAAQRAHPDAPAAPAAPASRAPPALVVTPPDKTPVPPPAAALEATLVQ